MSVNEGNAWALRRAKEREQMRLSGDTEQGSLSSMKSVKTISPELGKLDFDSDLALPMPNPRTARANSIVNDTPPSLPTSGSGSGSLWSRSIPKKRSFTEPGRLAAAAASTSATGEKKSEKKSTFKALKAKLSFKDLKKEFRKEVPPASTMPKITILRDDSSSLDSFAAKGNNFEVERLYTPRPRVMEVGSGSSSLSRKSSVIRLDDCLKDFDKASDSSVRTPMKDGGGGEGARFKHSLIHSNEAEEGHTSTLLDAVLLSGSSPAARTGELRNSRLPEVVSTPQRACSYAAEPASPKSAPSTVRESEAARTYSPSVYETILSDRTSDLPRRDHGVTSIEEVISLTPTRDSDSSVKKGSDTRLSALTSPASTFLAGPDGSSSEYVTTQVPVDRAQLLGSTGRGGFAPTPPDPSYQNTAALEEQLASHVEQLHFHVQHAASKLVKTFEDKNAWHMDQVLRHVDTMVDLAQAINKKAAAQTELLKEAQTAVADVRAHIDTLRREVRVIKSKIITAIHEEIGKLRYDLQEEGTLGPGNPASEGILTPSAGLQGPSIPLMVNRDLSAQDDGRDKLLPRKEDGKYGEKKKKTKNEQEENKERKQAAPSSVLRSANLVNSSSSAYLSVRDPQHQITEKRVAWKDDFEDASGSPTPKASTFLDLPDLLVPAIEQAEALLTSAAQPKMDKPAPKRSFFNLLRHRDSDSNASRTQENKPQPVDNNKAQDKLTTPNPSNDPSLDPSTIHPVLRTPEQSKILAERDLERIRLEKHQLAMLTTPSPTPARRPGVLKLSKSHSSIGGGGTSTPESTSSSPPTLHGWPLPDVYKNRLPAVPSRSLNSTPQQQQQQQQQGFDNPYPIFRHPVPASAASVSIGSTTTDTTPVGFSPSQGGSGSRTGGPPPRPRRPPPLPLELISSNTTTTTVSIGRKREGSGRHRSGTLERVDE
ncbi:hypothetical protein BO83DRAFT_447499 [Aspergillus eucalypticola CBS 122712]|uniref:Uncharacterized protein n=1 Tax=Aspergillus eucalypticola (strain CBS 122712 / IBT 29274) TaxID=1448314 RepID=A0A317VCJ5_ASPEC|nr:uncharacterized protein BO83DRAFT_447499 [Aspergillus eucalypticola CBS 122712]PWY70708.1 hypothetical protein BO83DRAFT_447499 [Aspergillus eucalypticola CBS 122712]